MAFISRVPEKRRARFSRTTTHRHFLPAVSERSIQSNQLPLPPAEYSCQSIDWHSDSTPPANSPHVSYCSVNSHSAPFVQPSDRGARADTLKSYTVPHSPGRPDQTSY